jgi:hypothetical protein
MWSSRARISGLAIAVTVAGLLIGGGAASAATGEDGSTTPSYLIPTQLSAGVKDTPLPAEFQSAETVPANVSQGILRLEVERPELKIVGGEWDAKLSQVRLYAAGDPSAIGKALDTYGLAGDVVLRPAKYGPDELQAQIVRITGKDGRLPSGHQVVQVTPKLDGSRLEVTLDETLSSVSEPALPNVDIPIDVTYGPAVVAATRDVFPNPQYFIGAYMNDNMGNGCSTGYRVTRLSDSVAGMVSAEHCGNHTGAVPWYYSSWGFNLGTYQGSAWPGGANIPDLAFWTGAGVDQLVPGILLGNNTVPGSAVYAVKGAAASIVGSIVCYSGAYSGTVCNNPVTATNVTVCYSGGGGCYYRLDETLQSSGIPAAGNGDSGGPVYAALAGQVYAAGIISGMRNASTSCTGDPGVGGRQCSADLFFAPIPDIFTMGYGLNYIP